MEQVALALKLDAGTLRFDIRPQDLGVIVRGVAQAVDVGDHPLEVDAAGPLEAPVDSIQVAFVIRQLVENAAMYSPPDSPISIRLGREGGDAVVEVGDRGPGSRPIVARRSSSASPSGGRPGTRTAPAPASDSSSPGPSPGSTEATLRPPTARRGVRCSASGFLRRAEWRGSRDHAPHLRRPQGADRRARDGRRARRRPPARGATGPRPRDGDRALGRASPRRRADGHRLQGRGHVGDRGDPPHQGDLAGDQGRDHHGPRRGSPPRGSRRGGGVGLPREGRGGRGGPRGREGSGRGRGPDRPGDAHPPARAGRP